MDKFELEKRTKRFALKIIEFVATLPHTKAAAIIEREFKFEVQRSTNLPLPLGEGRGEGLRANTFWSLVGSVNKLRLRIRHAERIQKTKVDASYRTRKGHASQALP
jgi:hypothetical protein